MNKTMKKFSLAAVAVALLALTACNDKDTESTDSNGRVAVRVTNAGITSATVTGSNATSPRATDAAWQKEDAIGILLLEAGTGTPIDGKTAYKYTTVDEMGHFEPSSTEHTAFYPTQNKETDVLAFYPYREIAADLLVPVSTKEQTSLAAIDLMVADKSTGHSAAQPEVSLAFSHKLVKLVVSVDCEESAADVDLSNATVSLAGTATRASWNLATATLTADATTESIGIPTTYDAVEKKLSGTAIVLPTAAGKDVKFVVTTAAGKSFDAPLPATSALAAGTVNTLRVHLTKTEAAVTATVADWTTGVTADLPSLKMTIDAASGTAEGIDKLSLWMASTPATKVNYTFDATTKAWTSATPFYLENLAATDAFYARFTPTAATDPVTKQADVLGNTTAATVKDGLIALTLNHLMAKVTLNLKRGENFPDKQSLEGATITLPGMHTTATVSDTNVATTSGDAKDLAITIAPPADANTPSATADDAAAASTHFIIAPQSIAAGTTLSVTLADNKTYIVKLAEGITLKAGANNSLTLTLSPTETKVAVTVKDWEDTTLAEQEVSISGIAGGIGIDDGEKLTPAAGDKLTLTHKGTSTSADYIYKVEGEAGAWSTDAPIYWDNLPTNDNHTFHLLYTPAATPIGNNETDYMAATINNVEFNTALSFELSHVMAQFEVKLEPGTDYKAEDFAGAVVTLNAVAPLSSISADGMVTLSSTTEARTMNSDAAGTAHNLILAPQSFIAGEPLATIQVKGVASTYTVKVPTGGITLIPGKKTVMTVKLSKTEVGGITVTKADWTTGEKHEGDADYEG